MNCINDDSAFTTEFPEDLPMARLPTLEFMVWLVYGLINHSYNDKVMKTPFLTMKRSAMEDHQRSSILANELVRRLSNINYGNIGQEETNEVVENFILVQQDSVKRNCCEWNSGLEEEDQEKKVQGKEERTRRFR